MASSFPFPEPSPGEAPNGLTFGASLLGGKGVEITAGVNIPKSLSQGSMRAFAKSCLSTKKSTVQAGKSCDTLQFLSWFYLSLAYQIYFGPLGVLGVLQDRTPNTHFTTEVNKKSERKSSHEPIPMSHIHPYTPTAPRNPH